MSVDIIFYKKKRSDTEYQSVANANSQLTISRLSLRLTEKFGLLLLSLKEEVLIRSRF